MILSQQFPPRSLYIVYDVILLKFQPIHQNYPFSIYIIIFHTMTVLFFFVSLTRPILCTSLPGCICVSIPTIPSVFAMFHLWNYSVNISTVHEIKPSKYSLFYPSRHLSLNDAFFWDYSLLSLHITRSAQRSYFYTIKK